MRLSGGHSPPPKTGAHVSYTGVPLDQIIRWYELAVEKGPLSFNDANPVSVLRQVCDVSLHSTTQRADNLDYSVINRLREVIPRLLHASSFSIDTISIEEATSSRTSAKQFYTSFTNSGPISVIK